MNRILSLCLLTLVIASAVIVNKKQTAHAQSAPKGFAAIVERPGEAAALGLVNQAEARLLNEGKLRVPAIGTGTLPKEKSALQWGEIEPPLPGYVKGRVLILYDNPANGVMRKAGLAYAIMLANLLGHFDAEINMQPIDQYTRGSVELYQATFYLGSHYDNAVPAVFLRDVRRTTRTVVWFKYNLWQFAWNQSYDFSGRFGFTFAQMKGFDTPPASDNQMPGFFDTVVYKTLPFTKFYHYDAAGNVAYADPDLGVTQIVDAQKARTLVFAGNSRTGEVAPYVMRSGRFWYFADLPFTFIGPRDRYVVFCDLLHDILNQNHTENHRAMLRLEDVGAKVETKSFNQLVDYLNTINVPFAVSLIPNYRDPHGVYNNGKAESIDLASASNLLQAVDYASKRGGSVVMHGHTHQNESLRYPTGVTGDDYEFWDAMKNRPVANDAETQWLQRIDLGLSTLRQAKVTPFAWETPHYQGSPNSYRAARQRFAVKYERGVYYTADRPDLTAGDLGVSQFFPYVIQSDYYGHRVLPENLGNVVYSYGNSQQSLQDRPKGAVCGQRTSLSQTDSLRSSRNARLTMTGNHFVLYENARYAWVVRDGFASFFFHPYLLRADMGVPALTDLQTLVNGLAQLGYRWKDASKLANEK